MPVSVVQTLVPRGDLVHSGSTSVRPDATPRPQDNLTIGSHRRKRVPRRRIVDLSREESLSTKDVKAASTPKDLVEQIPVPSSEGAGASPCDATSPDGSFRPLHPESVNNSVKATPKQEISSHQLKEDPGFLPTNLDVDGNSYRQRLEALKHEVGNSWLSALGEAGWNPNKNMNVVPLAGPAFPAPPPLVQTTNHIMVSEGRTLG